MWIVRSDYNAAVTINEVIVDERSRALVQNSGIRSITALVQALYRDDSLYLVSDAEEMQVNGLKCIVFQQENKMNGDIRRIILFSTRGRLFEASALSSGKGNNEVFVVQQRLLETLKW